jgi:transcriptional regulator with XRE-family HTH domain
MNPEKIGKFIYELRKEKNLSQYQLADMIPISRQAVSKWERGKTTPDTQTLLRLSEIYDVTINELLIGEKLLENTIEGLEETTLSILDESNKKTKKIKKITITSILIIVVLLLLFLSYYFINSYNSIEVYMIGGANKHFNTNNGVLVTTKGKSYIKLGKLRYYEDIKIKSIELYYLKDNKKKLIAKDEDIDNLTIMESFGYSEKLPKEDMKYITKNSYLEITYNDNEISKIKLEFKRDFKNNNFFFSKEHNNLKISEGTPEQDESKEETKPTIKEEEPPQEPEKEEKPKEQEKPKEEYPTPETKPQEPEPPQEVQITPELIVSKIKEKCSYDLDSYICELDGGNILLMYYEDLKQITIITSDDVIEYMLDTGEFICGNGNCQNAYSDIVKNNIIN